MQQVFMIHGSYGNPEENWFPWLRKELERRGMKVIAPVFPTPEKQSLSSWRNVFSGYEDLIGNKTILIGHSLGPAFILDVLQRIPQKVKAAYFVAPFVSPLGNPTFDSVNKTFYQKFAWKKIQEHCGKFLVFYSDNDPYVPVSKIKEVAESLHAQTIEVKKAGHFNSAAGYTTFRLLLEHLEKELKK